MISYIEKLFPEAVAFVKGLSLSKRLLIFLALVGIPLVLTAAYNYREFILRFLHTRVELSIYSILLLTFAPTLLVLLLLLYRKIMAKRSTLLRFTEAWIEYFKFMELFINEIDAYLLRDNKNFMENFDRMLPSIQKYHEQRARLREMLFTIGEVNLAITKNHNWEELKTEYDIFKNRNYQTPFSFLLDFRNPISAINGNGKELWAALHISDEFIEYLSYKHRGIKKLRQA
jgi:hypothetical protein